MPTDQIKSFDYLFWKPEQVLFTVVDLFLFIFYISPMRFLAAQNQTVHASVFFNEISQTDLLHFPAQSTLSEKQLYRNPSIS